MSDVIISEELPATIESFKNFVNRIAVTPEGGAVCIVTALSLFSRRVCEDCLSIIIHRDRLQEYPDSFEGWRLQNHDQQLINGQILDKPWIPASYYVGTSPVNSYSIPPLPFRFSISRDTYSSSDPDRKKVFVTSSGADSPRPVTLKRDDRGIWKALEWSSLLLGVRPPEKAV